jgi:hypothetical protein
MDSVPFHCEAFAGFGAIQGVARLEPSGLRLQYQTRDAVLGVLRSGMKSTLVPVESLVLATFRSGFLGLFPKIEVRVSDLTSIADIPSTEGGKLKLRVAFGDRDDARKLAHLLGGLLAEQRLDHLQNELDRMSSAGSPIQRSASPPPASSATEAVPAARQPQSE